MASTPDRRKAFELAQARERAMRERGEIDTAEDVARSSLTGLGEGVAGVVGMPMDMFNLATRGGDWLGRKAGMIDDTPEHRAWLDDSLKSINDSSWVPTSEEALQAMNDYTNGLGLNSEGLFEHKPRTTVGKYARTMGEFAPSLLTGPAGAARKGAMWLGSSLASETAGQLAEGTGYEDLARLGGAIAGGGRPRFRRPGPHTPRPTAEWKSLGDAADARLAIVGERNPWEFAEAGLARNAARAGENKGIILDEITSSGKPTREGFASLARDDVKMKIFSPSEQAAIQRAGGNSRAEEIARRVERNAPSPLPFAEEVERAIGNVSNASKTGTRVGGALGTFIGRPITGAAAGTLVGAGMGLLPSFSRMRKPVAGSIAEIISNRNIRNAEREIRNGVKPGANRSEARRMLINAVLQNQAIQAGQ